MSAPNTTGLKCKVLIIASFFFLTVLRSMVFAQGNPCDEIGSDCRVMTASEVKSLKERFMALRAVLPVPDTSRWAIAKDVDDSYTMPFIAESNLAPAITCRSWKAGCFTEQNSISFPYDSIAKSDKTKGNTTSKDNNKDKGGDLQNALAWVQSMQADIGNRIEIIAYLLPYAYSDDNVVGNPGYIISEKNASFLSFTTEDGTNLTMVFGARTNNQDESENLDKPAKNLAPVIAIELDITGPDKAEVDALKKKINRKAFEALLGPVVK